MGIIEASGGVLVKEKLLREIYKFSSEDKAYHVEIDLDTYRDVYSEWDYSPFVNRDLDEDLIDYVMECSYEITLKRRMIIDFFIPGELFNEKREDRSKEGFSHYFSYQVRKTKGEIVRLVRSTFVFGLIGASLLVGSNFAEGLIPSDFLGNTLYEGLIIGAWVAIWEMFSIWYFEISKLRLKMKHFKRLCDAEIVYHYKSRRTV